MGSNFWNWVTPSPKSRELKDTQALLAEVRARQQDAPIDADEKGDEFVFELVHDICERRGYVPSTPLGEALWQTIWGLLYLEGFVVDLPESDTAIEALSMDEGVALRETLRRHLRFLANQDHLLPAWREKLAITLSGMLEYFPLSVFIDPDEYGKHTDDAVVLPEATGYALCDNLPDAIERLIITMFDEDIRTAKLFEEVRERFEDNLLFASGIPRERRHDAHPAKLAFPTSQTRRSAEYIVDAYLQGTPFARLFHSPMPFAIPFPARFEHTHIVGGTGHGKTQLMQFLIHHDLVRSQQDHRSVVVIDSQGDLIRTISHLGMFSPSAEASISDRLVLIDPNDVEYPVCLNMFDFNRDRLSGFAPVDREKILNATVELYEYFFGALLGAELTQRQGLIFRYLARLLLEISDSTIHTLRELMENGEAFRPYIERLQGTTRSFFETRFFDRQFNETKKQILTRLWGVLSNTTLERMFSHTRNKVDMFELLNQGKVVLINTAKDLLGQEGASIFGRFFICLIAQAAVQRAVLAPHERRPGFVYIDEAQDYFDDNISHLLNQARKYRLGLVFAHQNLDQLSAGLRSSVLSSTTIKFAGGVSAKDANTLDSEMRCGSEFLLAQRKDREHTEFACFIKNYTTSALSVQIPLGHMERLPTLSYEDHRELLEANRASYSAPPMLPDFTYNRTSKPEIDTGRNTPPGPTPSVQEIPPAPLEDLPPPSNVTPPAQDIPPPETAPSPPMTPPEPRVETRRRRVVEPGVGGQQHKYLQSLIKNLAEARGFRANIEEPILDGAGRVDVALTQGPHRIAFEISVTTKQDHELSNIEKCLAAGYRHIVLVGATPRHVKTLSTFIEKNLDEEHQGRVQYIAPDSLPECIDSLPMDTTETKTVRGYKVKVNRQSLSPEDIASRRAAIAQVIAQSVSRAKG